MSDARVDDTELPKQSGKTSRSRDLRHAPAPFQRRAIEQMAVEIAETHRQIATLPSQRYAIARERGMRVLVSPTGSGKTLMLGRAIETLLPDPVVPLAGFRGSVWFWFSPYSGLVEQTKLSLASQCPGLRLRDPARDRNPVQTRDGDVFVATWGSVAANNREARKLRRSGERAYSIDGMIEALRQDGWFIGCIIDEAHVNFGTSAKAAATFFTETLKPDTTILATATPRDDKLAKFFKTTKITDPKRISVGRQEVVDANLNKRGLILAHLALKDGEKLTINPEEAIMRAALIRHRETKEALASHGLSLTPLLLVQVPDDKKGSKTDEAGRARDHLVNAGLPSETIRIHTSGQPDPEFRTLAADEDVEALIFKVSAATGFDAPRAFSLVSLRPIVTPEFGTQIIGRVMRVDPRVRARGGALGDPKLSRATVFVTSDARQKGLEAAAEALKALRSSIEPIAGQVPLFDIDDVRSAGPQAEGLVEKGGMDSSTTMVQPTSLTYPHAVATRVAQLQEAAAEDDPEPGLFGTGTVAGTHSDRRQPGPRPGEQAYELNSALGVPNHLQREVEPSADELPQLSREAAEAFDLNSDVLALLGTGGTQIDIELRLRELFTAHPVIGSQRLSAPPSAARVAEAAQQVFQFSDDIDPRLFRKHLIDRIGAQIVDQARAREMGPMIGRVIDQIAVFRPAMIKDALATALARHVRVEQSDPLPRWVVDREGLLPAERAAYGVFPGYLNGPERRFAEMMDTLPGVKWWLRNPSHPSNRWAVRLVLPNGRGFYPDFVLAVEGRRTLDQIALAEVKDDGISGRLNSDDNLMKIRTRLREYGAAVWVSEEAEQTGRFVQLSLSDDRDRIVRGRALTIDDLREVR